MNQLVDKQRKKQIENHSSLVRVSMLSFFTDMNLLGDKKTCPI